MIILKFDNKIKEMDGKFYVDRNGSLRTITWKDDDDDDDDNEKKISSGTGFLEEIKWSDNCIFVFDWAVIAAQCTATFSDRLCSHEFRNY